MEFDRNGIEINKGTITRLFSIGKNKELARIETYHVVETPKNSIQLPASLAREGVSQTGGIEKIRLITGQSIDLQQG